ACAVPASASKATTAVAAAQRTARAEGFCTAPRYARRQGRARGLLLLHDPEADPGALTVVSGRVGGGERQRVAAGLELASLQAAVEGHAHGAGGLVTREAPERETVRVQCFAWRSFLVGA